MLVNSPLKHLSNKILILNKLDGHVCPVIIYKENKTGKLWYTVSRFY